MNYGMKISQPGYSVLTATSIQLVASSAFNSLKIQLIGTVNITIPANTNTQVLFSATVAHGLSFIPAVLIYPSDNGIAAGINFVQPSGAPARASELDRFQFSYKVDGTNITVYAKTNSFLYFPIGSAITLVFKYYIFTQELV